MFCDNVLNSSTSGSHLHTLHAAEHDEENVIVVEKIPVISCLFKFPASFFLRFSATLRTDYKIKEFFDMKTIQSLGDKARSSNIRN